MNASRRFAWAGFVAIGAWMVASGSTARAQECKNRGQLDTLYCDDNNDLVADVPTDPKKWRDPSTLVFAYTPVEDPAVYQNIFKPFTDYLASAPASAWSTTRCSRTRREIEAMRSGRLHIAGFSTGRPVSPSISPARSRSLPRARRRARAATT